MTSTIGSKKSPSAISILDLNRQYKGLKKEITLALRQVCESSHYIQGPQVASFAQNFAQYCQAHHCIPVANGTDALYLSLRALGIGPGDEVITSAFSFIAAAEAIANTGATPVFADILTQTYSINPDHIESLITPKTKAIIPVHLYGLPCDLDKIMSIAQKHNLPIIEDACQAHGAHYQSKRVGALGQIGCFSFYPTKNLGAFGDAGAVTTNNDALAQKIRSLANHGSGQAQYDHVDSGINSRMDELQAAVLNIKLRHLDQWNSNRRKLAQIYTKELSKISEIVLPVEPVGQEHVFHLYVIRLNQRDALSDALKNQGITTKIHYPKPLHLLPAYQKLGYGPGSLPESERAAQEVLALPLFPELRPSEVRRVCKAIKNFFKK